MAAAFTAIAVTTAAVARKDREKITWAPGLLQRLSVRANPSPLQATPPFVKPITPFPREDWQSGADFERRHTCRP